MLKRALPKEYCEKMKNKKFPLRGLFWDFEIFGKNFKFSIFIFWPRMVGNMLKRALPKVFCRKTKNKIKIRPQVTFLGLRNFQKNFK